MKFTKLQGAGNDFILVESNDLNRDWSGLARKMCDRHFGIGADGLLVLLPSKVADFKMREFNTDGSEAEACGNGLRCLLKYIVETKLAKAAAPEISVETMAGVRKFKPQRSGGKVTKLQVGMGTPRFDAREIPVDIDPAKAARVKSMLNYSITVGGKELFLNFVSMGNPHAVYFWQKPVAEFPLSQVGPEVEHHRIFPRRTNFEVARVIDRNQIEVRVWERGVGETLACGTGSCAVAVAAQLNGYVASPVKIKLPGGILDVDWDGKGEVLLGGPAEIVFTGEWQD